MSALEPGPRECLAGLRERVDLLPRGALRQRDAQMRGAEVAPLLGLANQLIRVVAAQRRVDADGRGVAAGLARVVADPLEGGEELLVVGRELRQPAVREAADALDGLLEDLAVGAHPDRDWALYRHRVEAHAV